VQGTGDRVRKQSADAVCVLMEGQPEGTGADVKWSLLVVFHRCAERVKMRASEARLQWRGYSAVHGSAHGCAAWMEDCMMDYVMDYVVCSGNDCCFWLRTNAVI